MFPKIFPTSLLLFSLLFAPPAALGNPASSSAQGATDTEVERLSRGYFKNGQDLAALGEYRDAYKQFKTGYDLSRRPLFLFNMAECANQAKQYARARDDYQRFLAVVPSGAMAEIAQERLRALPALATADHTPPPALSTHTTAAPPANAAPVAHAGSPASATNLQAIRDPAVERNQPPSTLVRREGERTADKPIWKKWPFWAVVGGATIASIVLVTSSQGDGTASNQIDWRN